MDYKLLCEQLSELSRGSSDLIPLTANASAILYHAMPDINWAGFYIVKNGELLLGPFQGKAACIRIQKGSGVCGTAWAEDAVQTVPDVHAFPGHIACDSASRSEIVIPIHSGSEVIAVLDIDSPLLGRFSEEDRIGLEAFAAVLETALDNESRRVM